MKNILLATVVSLLSISSIASEGNCLERLTSKSWPNDKKELVLSCKLTEGSLNNNSYVYGDSLCFGISRTESSDFKDYLYKALRYEEGRYGSLSDIVITDEDGDVFNRRESKLKIKDDIIKMTNKNLSYEMAGRWKSETTVDLENLTVKYEHFDRKFLRYEKRQSLKYECEQID